MGGHAPVSSPQVIGVAGKCCAGKDLVTGWLLEHGRREINVDRIGHEALAAEHARIVATFGREIVDERGTIDRRALGNIVFADQNQRHRLESIVHPWMRERVRREIAEWRGEQGLIINAALLFYMELDSLCDAVLLV